MRACLEYSSISILVNCCLIEEFTPAKGLRQGDPLAPFLFLVVAEGFEQVYETSGGERSL